MLEVKNWEVSGLDRAIIASGNPMTVGVINTLGYSRASDKELDRGYKLGKAPQGSGHDNFLSGILVTFDIKYPEYWSPEFQRYHFAQIVSSQSKMHKLTSMGKDPVAFKEMFNEYVSPTIISFISSRIDWYNQLISMKPEDDGNYYSEERTKFTPKEQSDRIYKSFMECVSNLPMGFEKWMTVTTNYLQLKTIFKQRRQHKLKGDWGAFCDWCESLPRFMELTGNDSLKNELLPTKGEIFCRH